VEVVEVVVQQGLVEPQVQQELVEVVEPQVQQELVE
jgi:hypothetical protein